MLQARVDDQQKFQSTEFNLANCQGTEIRNAVFGTQKMARADPVVTLITFEFQSKWQFAFHGTISTRFI